MRRINFTDLAKHLLRWLGVLKPGPSPEPPPPPPPPPAPPVPPVEPELRPALPRVRCDKRVFRVGPDIWRYQGVSAFTLFKRYIDGQDIVPYLEWAKGIGANTVRVFCRLSWGRLDPRKVGNFGAQLHLFLRTLEWHGLYCELTVLADCKIEGYILAPAEQHALLMQVGEIAQQHPNVFLEWGNEWPKNGWAPDVRAEALPFKVLQCRGSSLDDHAPPGPPLDYGTFHAGRAGEWPRKMGKQAAEWSWGCGTKPPGGPFGVPFVDDEPQKIVAGKYDNPDDFYAGHALAALFVAGSTIHYQSGLYAERPTAKERACVEAAAQAWRDIPPDAPLGAYTRGPSSICPLEHADLTDDPRRGALRTFAMLNGRKAICVAVRPGPDWKPRPRDQWRIVERKGRLGNVVFLER